MNTLISPNQPQIIFLQNHQLGHITSSIKSIYPSLSKFRSSKLYADTRGKGFSQRPTKEEEEQLNKSPPGGNGDDDELPPVVINRIIGRILVYVGLPMVIGLGLLRLFGFLKENHIEVPLWVSFLSTFIAFGSSALGVPFGALSTSWDEDKEGSLLGFKEASYNWDQMWKEDSD